MSLKVVLLITFFSGLLLLGRWSRWETCAYYSTPNPRWLGWVLRRDLQYRMILRTLSNMTHELIMDAQVRLRQAAVVSSTYRGGLSYELGTISAAIKDIFKRMVNNYRFYRNNSRTNLDTLVLGIYVMVGDYLDIRMEKGLYYEVLKMHREKQHQVQLDRDALIQQYKDQHKAETSKTAARRHLVNVSRADDDYKRSLRYKAWTKKWANFSPEIEGIDVNIVDDRLIL